MASTADGPRFVAALQDPTDTCCYKDFFESEVRFEAVDEAQAAADKEKRKAIVYDRKNMEITERLEPKEFKLPDTEATAGAPIAPHKRTSKRKKKS